MMMSIAKNFEEALGFLPHEQTKGPVARFVALAGVCFGALRDGLAAAHKYGELTSRGVPHDVAVQKVFEQHLGA
jgi:hypothetical protein